MIKEESRPYNSQSIRRAIWRRLHGFVLSVFARPLGIVTRAEKTNPALTEFSLQPDSLNIYYDPLNVVWDEMECKDSINFQSITGSSITVPGLTNWWNTKVSASIHGSVDLEVTMTAKNDRIRSRLEMAR